jgi:hypothetical protein
LPTVAKLPSDDGKLGATMSRLLAALTVVGSLSLLGCSSPCRIVEDPDCDKTETDHNCLFLCAPENGEQIDDSDEMENEQEFDSSDGVDG